MVSRAVGRREEVGRILAALAEVHSNGRGRIVDLTGEAGIGKSTVTGAVVTAADETGWRVWSASPTAAEAELPWTGLGQLLAGIRLEEYDELAASHLDQLAAVTTARRTDEVSPELLAFGLAALLDAASAAAPLLIVVDDTQWLDRATAGAFAYALRGMPRRRAVAVLSRRDDEAMPIEPARLVALDAYIDVKLTGLSLASLREIVAEATGLELGRAELARLGRRTGGNPLHTIELARTVAGGTPVDHAALPESLRDSVGARVAVLPPATRRALGAAALTARPTPDRLMAALPDVDVLDALGPAETAGVVELRQTTQLGRPPVVVFSHPLLAAAAIDALSTKERGDLHAALAASADGIIERATHLVAGGVEPDETIAAELDRAAREAHTAGAIDAAATFAAASMAATPAATEPTVRLERAYNCALYHSQTGRYAEAESVLMAVAGDLPRIADERDAAALADLRERLALVEGVAAANLHGVVAAEASIERTLAFTTDPHRRYVLHARLVRSVLHQSLTRGLDVAERVFGEGSEHQGLDGVLGSLMLLTARAAAGEPFDADAAIALVDTATTDEDQRAELASLLVEPLVWTDHPRTVEITERAISRDVVRGNVAAELTNLHQLVGHLIVRGDWRRAEQLDRRLSEYTTEFADRLSAQADRAQLLAGLGDTERAAELLARTIRELDAATEGPLIALWVRSRAAAVTHMLGQPAAEDLLDIEQRYAEIGVHSVRGPKFRRDLVEALVAAGQLVEAAAAARRLAADAERNQVATAIAESDAATAVVASAHGDHEHARARFAAAIDTQRLHELNYELARTLLAAGAASRRANRRAEARRHLDEAAELFAGMGAVVWRRRCDDEAERLGGRRPHETDELTPTERQIAELVASGMTNAEVAAALFVSVRTVESSLTRVYRKLGIRSRSALARTLEGDRRQA